jgi:ABC-type long-subunit fatty acid transport system fused permease/ATPase subunit
MTILNAGVDLISFSGILYSIYPPLFVALLVYSLGGTAASVFLGRKLVGLNFQQEAQEANFRLALLRPPPATDVPTKGACHRAEGAMLCPCAMWRTACQM